MLARGSLRPSQKVFCALLVIGLALLGWKIWYRPWFQRAETAQDLLIDPFGHDVYWLDDNTLAFAASKGERAPLIKDSNGGTLVYGPGFKEPGKNEHMYIWSLDSEPKIYQAEKWLYPGTVIGKNYLCARDGNIYYSVKPTTLINPEQWSTTVMVGPPGKETPRAFSLGAINRGEMPWNLSRFGDGAFVDKRCEDYSDQKMVGHAWFISRHADTILDFGPFLPFPHRDAPLGHPLQLIDIKDNHITPLPSVDPQWADVPCVQPLSWEDAFVVWRCDTGNADLYPIQSYPVWKIHTNGSVSQSTIHTGNLWGIQLIPSRVGYFATVWTTKDDRGGGRPNETGLYSVGDDGEMHQLERGYFRILAVSPNGCLGAFSAEGGPFYLFTAHLVVFDLCKARKG
jgi:hypothetical protein